MPTYCAREKVIFCDRLMQTNYLNFKGQQHYKTIRGGLLTILVIVPLLGYAIFEILATFSGSNMTATKKNQLDYRSYSFTNSGPTQTKFNMAVSIYYQNFTSIDYNYFDLTIQIGNQSQIKQQFPLEPCKVQNWEKDVNLVDEKIPITTYWCPPDNFVYPLARRLGNPDYKEIVLAARKCNASSGLNKTCLNVSNLYKQRLRIQFHFLNTFVNFDQEHSITRYIDSSNCCPFTSDNSAEIKLYITKYSITSDKSRVPEAVYKFFGINPLQIEQEGGYIRDGGNIYHLPNDNQTFPFAKIVLSLSGNKLVVKKVYPGISDVISDIGGFYGGIKIILLIAIFYPFHNNLYKKMYEENDQNDQGKPTTNGMTIQQNIPKQKLAIKPEQIQHNNNTNDIINNAHQADDPQINRPNHENPKQQALRQRKYRIEQMQKQLDISQMLHCFNMLKTLIIELDAKKVIHIRQINRKYKTKDIKRMRARFQQDYGILNQMLEYQRKHMLNIQLDDDYQVKSKIYERRNNNNGNQSAQELNRDLSS